MNTIKTCMLVMLYTALGFTAKGVHLEEITQPSYILKDTTTVVLDLNHLASGQIQVEVRPPAHKTSWEYVIPEIIPGTYSKVNYIRFYNDFKAFDEDGNQLKIKQKKNVLQITGNQALAYLRYNVKPSLGDSKIWDNIVTCAGSAFTSNSALINFQLTNGYFEGFQVQPFKIEVMKPEELYGASSINKVAVSSSIDLLFTNNYGELIDQPILYAVADTTSFKIRNNVFKIASFAESGKNTSEQLKPRLTTVMHAIDSFSGFTSEKEYHFLMYYTDVAKLKGPFKYYGTGSALEHKFSSVYYNTDQIYDTTFSYYNGIVAHEYLHTITPLNLHSDKIAQFNFREADMSRHVWLYEGLTDYLADMSSEQSEQIVGRMRGGLAAATQSSLNREKQSMTESGLNIIRKRNAISWIKKMMDLMNFYEKGKLIAFAMDMEIMEKSNGERRLIDVILEMNKDFTGKYFDDTELLDLLEGYTFEGFKEQFRPYIEGNELPDYNRYFDKLGWTFYPKKTKRPTYGSFVWKKDKETDNYYVRWKSKKDELGLELGDSILTVNTIAVEEFMNSEGAYDETVAFPELEDNLVLKIKRNGEIIELAAQPKIKKEKFARIRVNPNPSEKQLAFQRDFFSRQ